MSSSRAQALCREAPAADTRCFLQIKNADIKGRGIEPPVGRTSSNGPELHPQMEKRSSLFGQVSKADHRPPAARTGEGRLALRRTQPAWHRFRSRSHAYRRLQSRRSRNVVRLELGYYA